MASVKRQPGSPFWYACYRDRFGTRRQRSTGTRDKNEAIRIAAGMESLGRLWIRDRAERMVDEIAEAFGEQYRDRTLVRDFFRTWKRARDGGWAESTRKTFDAVHTQFLSRYGTEPLGGIEKRHISEYRDFLTGNGRSPGNVRQHIKYLRRVFATAVEQGRITENPAMIALPKPRQSVKQPFSLLQFKQLLNATDGEWHDLILVAGLTGQRLNDVLALTSADVFADKIGFRRKKNKDVHWVPRHPAIQIETVGKLFPVLDQLPKSGSRSVSAQFRDKVLPRIGIVQEYATGLNGCRQVTEFSFHSLRHMLSTELNRIGASPETRMAIVGHDDKKVSAGYTHADFAVASEMLAKVGV